VKKLRKWSKLKGKYPLICFKCGRIGHYAAKCPHKHDSDDEDEYKMKMFKKSYKKNFFSKQDDSDEEDDYAGSNEVLFMAFTNDDDYEKEEEGNIYELLISASEENGKLRKKVISLKIEKEEAKRKK